MCCSRCSRMRCTTRRARHRRRRRAGAHRAARRPVLATIENPHSRRAASAPATAWRSRTSASGSRYSSTPRRGSRRASANGRYRVDIEIPYRRTWIRSSSPMTSAGARAAARLLQDIAPEVPNVVAGEARNGIEALERLPASAAQSCSSTSACRHGRPGTRPACRRMESPPAVVSSPRTTTRNRSVRAERARLPAEAGARRAARRRAQRSRRRRGAAARNPRARAGAPREYLSSPSATCSCWCR